MSREMDGCMGRERRIASVKAREKWIAIKRARTDWVRERERGVLRKRTRASATFFVPKEAEETSPSVNREDRGGKCRQKNTGWVGGAGGGALKWNEIWSQSEKNKQVFSPLHPLLRRTFDHVFIAKAACLRVRRDKISAPSSSRCLFCACVVTAVSCVVS